MGFGICGVYETKNAQWVGYTLMDSQYTRCGKGEQNRFSKPGNNSTCGAIDLPGRGRQHVVNGVARLTPSRKVISPNLHAPQPTCYTLAASKWHCVHLFPKDAPLPAYEVMFTTA